ncbi:MAG: NifU family protein [Cyclobacteriaceae bacterium]
MASQELLQKIESALNSIRPYLKADGGDVKLLDVNDEMVVSLELLGSCGSCPMSAMTLKAGVAEAIKRVAPEITNVEAINLTAHDDPNAKLPNAVI